MAKLFFAYGLGNALFFPLSVGATTILLAGGDGLPASEHADHALVVPSETTARIQEMHLLLLHLIVDQVDAWAAE